MAGLPDGYPVELCETAILDDGTRLAIRPIVPDDAARLERLYARLSPESLYRRFFTPVPRFDPRLVDRLVHVDYSDRLALVALAGDEVVAVARYDRVAPGSTDAEAAIIVEDAWQHRGIGTRLLWRLSAAARARGVTAFVAVVLGANRPMMGLLAVLADAVETELDGSQYTIRVELGDA